MLGALSTSPTLIPAHPLALCRRGPRPNLVHLGCGHVCRPPGGHSAHASTWLMHHFFHCPASRTVPRSGSFSALPQLHHFPANPTPSPPPSRPCMNLFHLALVVSLPPPLSLRPSASPPPAICYRGPCSCPGSCSFGAISPSPSPPQAVRYRGPCINQVHACSPSAPLSLRPSASPPPSRAGHEPGSCFSCALYTFLVSPQAHPLPLGGRESTRAA